MTLQLRAVTVKQMPAQLDARGERLFFHEVESSINVDRPRVVFDCSQLKQLNKRSLHLLLCCLEEAIKRNGDIKLAALPIDAKAFLQATGMDRIFEIFDTVTGAVNSFRRHSVDSAPHIETPAAAYQSAGSAA